MTMPRNFLLTMGALSWLILASGAQAEKADRDKPINLDAQRATFDGITNVRILEGDVVMVQGSMRITAERVEIRTDSEQFITAVATGNPVTFRQKREGCDEYIDGFAQRAEFDDRKDVLKLISRARIKSGDDELKSDFIVYNSATDQYEVLGNLPDAAKSGGRVNMVIFPKTKTDGKKPCAKAAPTSPTK